MTVIAAGTVLAGCGAGDVTVLSGQARAMRYDPGRAGGLPVTEGYSGERPNGLPAEFDVENTDNGAVDQAARLAASDIQDYWKQAYPKDFGGPLMPVDRLVSFDPEDYPGPTVCGGEPDPGNAMYCNTDNSISWDRTADGFLAIGRQYFGGDIAIAGVLAHEFGHAIQYRAQLPGIDDSLVAEQQADCFAGVYLRWVAEGHSPRFVLSTGAGLNFLLAGALALRDSLSEPGQPQDGSDPHGTGLDRVGTMQEGFEQGAEQCARIDAQEIDRRRGDLPPALFNSLSQSSNMPVDQNALSALTEVLAQVFPSAKPPTITVGSARCAQGPSSDFAVYCPTDNTVAVDLAALQKISAPAQESSHVLLQGDNTAISLVTSRWVMALEQQRGLRLDTPEAAMRTACLTGVAQKEMAHHIDVPSGGGLTLGAGDLDEAISGLLQNGVVASDVNGTVIPAGFTRVAAFRSGLLGKTEDCLQRFPDA